MDRLFNYTLFTVKNLTFVNLVIRKNRLLWTFTDISRTIGLAWLTFLRK